MQMQVLLYYYVCTCIFVINSSVATIQPFTRALLIESALLVIINAKVWFQSLTQRD